MQEIKASFFIECEELLESLFDALQAMSEGKTDGDTINVVFRAVHSIKGGASAFALHDLVGFAHHFETVMDDLRAARIVADAGLVKLLFTCVDVLSDLVHAARDETEIDENAILSVVEKLTTKSAGSARKSDAKDEIVAFTPVTLDLNDFDRDNDLRPDVVTPQDRTILSRESKSVLINFKPVPELFISGNEPLFLLRSLSDLGPCETRFDLDAPKDFDDLDSLGHRITWSIHLTTNAERNAIDEIFEFVDGLCQLEITDNATVKPTEVATSLIAPEAAQFPPAEKSKLSPQSEPLNDAPTAAQAKAREASKPSPTVRVSLDRIDCLVNLVGELVINQSMLSQSISEADLAPSSTLDSGLEEFLQLTRDIQESVMMIRAQPIKSLFQRMSRIVRETSATVDKSVRLITVGENTEIDKTAIERLADPLTHMIRNSVDHGLEAPEIRAAVGKPETGEIKLSAFHKSGRVIIEIADDGAGIDREKVLRTAIEKDLIAPDAQLSDSETDQLLFLPGFSTSEHVSNLSGRGVGMDVVKSAIAELGGKITISSKPGEGCIFTISLPLTLAVVDGMLIGLENETLVVPLSTIAETLTLNNSDLRSLGSGNRVLKVRGELLPLLDLGCELGYRGPRESYDGLIALLIAQEDGKRAALIVDVIEDQRQVVIKGLQDSYGNVPGISAATILGNGQIALILDPTQLIDKICGRDGEMRDFKEAG